jgi:hypothetical protein
MYRRTGRAALRTGAIVLQSTVSEYTEAFYDRKRRRSTLAWSRIRYEALSA